MSIDRMLPRRDFLQGAAALAVLSSAASVGTRAQSQDGQEGMSKDIVMLHGASAGGWCLDKFRGVFESEGWTVHTPDLIGHGKDKTGADQKLVVLENRLHGWGGEDLASTNRQTLEFLDKHLKPKKK